MGSMFLADAVDAAARRLESAVVVSRQNKGEEGRRRAEKALRKGEGEFSRKLIGQKEDRTLNVRSLGNTPLAYQAVSL